MSGETATFSFDAISKTFLVLLHTRKLFWQHTVSHYVFSIAAIMFFSPSEAVCVFSSFSVCLYFELIHFFTEETLRKKNLSINKKKKKKTKRTKGIRRDNKIDGHGWKRGQRACGNLHDSRVAEHGRGILGAEVTPDMGSKTNTQPQRASPRNWLLTGRQTKVPPALGRGTFRGRR